MPVRGPRQIIASIKAAPKSDKEKIELLQKRITELENENNQLKQQLEEQRARDKVNK